ncbi:MAG: DUF1826 domain-containing protein [Pseudomonadota bacterium]
MTVETTIRPWSEPWSAAPGVELGMTATACPIIPVPDHVRLGGADSVLAGIRDPDITLAVWERPPPIAIGTLRGFPGICFTAGIDALGETLCAHLADRSVRRWHAPLIADVARLATIYANIMALDRVALRLERIDGNACWRFHADYVAVRLISTYVGSGTQWLDQRSVAASSDGESPSPRQLSCGDVGLFKGRLLAPHHAIVHRSPPIAGTGEERLLLVIDPDDRDV